MQAGVLLIRILRNGRDLVLLNNCCLPSRKICYNYSLLLHRLFQQLHQQIGRQSHQVAHASTLPAYAVEMIPRSILLVLVVFEVRQLGKVLRLFFNRDQERNVSLPLSIKTNNSPR